MELERFRQKEPEPKLHDYSWNEDRLIWYQELRKLLESAPRVRRFDDIPWEQVHQAYHKIYTGANMPDALLKLKRAPFLSGMGLLQVLPPGGSSGRHRHFMEAVFYILEGKGYEIHDEKRYDWEAGDLMCVPSYCVHQHFADPNIGASMFYVVTDLCQSLGIGATEQMKLHDDFKLPSGAVPLKDEDGKVIGYRRQDGMKIRYQAYGVSKEVMERRKTAAPPEKVDTTYDGYLQQYWQDVQWRQDCPHVVKTAHLPWENTRQGRIKYIAHPKIPSGILTSDCFLQEIPPLERSGKNYQVGEEMLFIVEGQGYSILDGVRWDWAKNDLLCIPLMTTQQHFNPDPKKPVKFLSVKSRIYSFIGHGGIEHFEDASTYR